MGLGFIFVSIIMFLIPIFGFYSRKFINISFLKWKWLLKIIGIFFLIILLYFRIQKQIFPELKNLVYQNFKVSYKDTRTQFIAGLIPFDLCPLITFLSSFILIFPKLIKEKWFMSIGLWGMYGAAITILSNPSSGGISTYFSNNDYTLSTHMIQYILSWILIIQAKTSFKRDYIKTKIVIFLTMIWAGFGVIIFGLTRSNTGITNDSWIIGSYKDPRQIFGFSETQLLEARALFWFLSIILIDIFLLLFTFLKNYLTKKDEKYKDKERRHLITNYLELKIDIFYDKTKKIINKIIK